MFLPCLHSTAFQSKSGSEKRSRDNATFGGSLHGTAFAWENKRDKLRAKARKEIQKRSFWRRFWVLLPPRAKVPRAGARNVPFSLMLRRCRSISLPPSRRCRDTSLTEGGFGVPRLRARRGDVPQGYLFRFAPLRGHRPLRNEQRGCVRITSLPPSWPLAMTPPSQREARGGVRPKGIP